MAPGDIVRAHISAFNRRDLDALMATLRDDAVWTTGQDTLSGAVALRDFFGGAMTGLLPRLDVRSILIDGNRVACELRETYGAGDDEREDFIAAFYVVVDDRIAGAKIYREGSADA